MYRKNKLCEICNKKLSLHDVFPNSMIRDNLFNDIQSHYPNFTRDGFVCFPDYRLLNAKYYERILEKERGRLSKLEKEVIDSLKEHELVSENTNEQFEEKLTLGERISDKLAQFGGSWSFIISFIVVLFGWMVLNASALIGEAFDPFPFILLNLVLSTLAAIQAPIILMSQNRQASKDRLKSDQDYLVNLKAELQIRQLNSRFDVFMKHHWHVMNTLIKSQEDLMEEMESVQESSKSD